MVRRRKNLSHPFWRTPQPAAKKTEQVSAEPVEELTDVREVNPERDWESPNYPRIDRVVNLLTTSPTRKHALLFTIDHRSFEVAFMKNFFRDWFGFDSGSLKIGIGLRFGILEDLGIGS